MNTSTRPPSVTRRQFLKTSAAVTALGTLSADFRGVFAAGTDTIRVGLIGCGARGIGAAMNCVLAAPGVEIVALGDVFANRAEAAFKRLKDNHAGKEWSCSREWKQADQVKATPETCFTGFDAYRQVLAAGADLVILAGPPHFRPQHFQAAIEAGKHVFMENPWLWTRWASAPFWRRPTSPSRRDWPSWRARNADTTLGASRP